jgi:hypothetical protein
MNGLLKDARRAIGVRLSTGAWAGIARARLEPKQLRTLRYARAMELNTKRAKLGI